MDGHPQIPGLRYIEGWLKPAEQAALLATIDALPWSDALSRRVQHYGYRYDYGRRGVDAQPLGPIPEPFAALARRLCEEGVMDELAQQVIINEYLPGQGIAAHIDCLPCFGPQIVSVSLGSGCEMSLRSDLFDTSIYLEPGSLLALEGHARDALKHGIPRRKSDTVQGKRRPRARRVSLTFRTMLMA